jgi:thioredoxin reductase
VISATGVRPNIGFLEGSEINCLQGILTDDRMQTNVQGIYAAGDCAEAFDSISGKTIVSAIQPNAADQAVDLVQLGKGESVADHHSRRPLLTAVNTGAPRGTQADRPTGRSTRASCCAASDHRHWTSTSA